MWISVFNWFLGILSIIIWGGAYVIYERHKVKMWFDNKFGKDDPMPPMPNQQQPLDIGENSTINFQQKPSNSDQPKE